MPILTSPTVAVVEKDYSQVVPFAPTGEGAIAGRFNKGPILQPVMISSVDQLETTFGTPDNGNYVDWFSAYNFLQYSGKLWVTRVDPSHASDVSKMVKNAGAKQGAVPSTGVKVINNVAFEDLLMNDPTALTSQGEFISKQPGVLGNSIRVVMVDEANWSNFASNASYKSEGRFLSDYVRSGSPGTSEFARARTSNESAGDEVHVFVIDADGKITGVAGRILEMWESLSKMDNAADYLGRNIHFGKFLNNYSEWLYWTGANPSVEFTVSSATWYNGTSTLVVPNHTAKQGDVITVSGILPTGYRGAYTVTSVTPTTISYAQGTPGGDGGTGTVVIGNIPVGASSSEATSGSFADFVSVYNVTCAGGQEGLDLGDPANAAQFAGALQDGFDLYLSKENYSVSYLITADYPVAVQTYVIQSIAEVRRDAIAFVSPHNVVGNKSVPFFDKTTLVDDLLAFRNITLNVSSSYGVMDSGYKYQFDGYNAVYRWIPLAADVAGLCARNDAQYESWYSPAGFNRGQIKNALKLSSVLSQADRDLLYPKQINAVVSFGGKSTVLYGDRTLQAKPSAFQSIHIRRMFIIIEKAIEEAAKYQLFELNNNATRTLFIGMIEPFLRSVKARDGLADFAIVCDSTNNTDDTIARGEFTADIYVKPLYSIQYVILNFVAVKSSVQFNQFVKA